MGYQCKQNINKRANVSENFLQIIIQSYAAEKELIAEDTVRQNYMSLS